MMADKICELIKDIRCERAAIIGGVASTAPCWEY